MTAETNFTQVGLNALELKDLSGLNTFLPDKQRFEKIRQAGAGGGIFLAFPAGTNAYGGSFSLLSVDTTTTALVGGVDPAKDPVTQPTTLEFGDGGLTVAADTSLLFVQMMEAGGSATNFGLMGTLGILDIPNQVTQAAIEPVQPSGTTSGPALVVQANPGTTGNVKVSANDETQVILIAGDYLSSGNIGVGTSVAMTNVNRTVTAQVGTAAGGPPLVSSFSGIGNMDVTANADGIVLPIALAGIRPAGGASQANGNSHGVDEHNPPNQEAANVPDPSAFGIGFSGDAAVALVNDTVQAFVNDGGTITGNGGTLSVTSTDQTNVAASTGAWSSQYGEREGLSAGLAGSVSLTFVTANVAAFLNGPTLDNLGLQVLATNSMLVGALAAGGS
ncbi:MAG: hypothetical protein ACK50P_17850, partial [Planctomycetaceae bacterium]